MSGIIPQELSGAMPLAKKFITYSFSCDNQFGWKAPFVTQFVIPECFCNGRHVSAACIVITLHRIAGLSKVMGSNLFCLEAAISLSFVR